MKFILKNLHLPQTFKSSFHLKQIVVYFLLFSSFHSATLFAATDTWDGGDASSDLSSGNNWSDNTAPANDDNLIFSGSLDLSPNNDSYTSFTDITFDNTSSAFTLGGNAFTLKGDITNNDADLQTISTNITLDTGTRTIDAASGDIILSGVINGSGALTKTGASQLTLSGSNTYTGATIVNGGTLYISADDNLGAVPGTETAGHLNMISGIIHFDADMTLHANRGIDVSGGTLEVNNNKTVTYAGDLAGSGTFTKRGGGTLVLTTANSITGEIAATQGTLRITHIGALGNTGSTTRTNVSVGDKLEIEITGGGTIANEEILHRGTIQLNSASGDITLSDDVFGYAGDTGTINVVDAADTLTISGTVRSDYSITKAGSGTLVLSGTNTLTGTTTASAGTLSLSGTASSTNLAINGATVTTSGGNKTFASLALSSGSLTGDTANIENLTLSNASTWTGGTYAWTVASGMGDSGSNTSNGNSDTINEASGVAGTEWDILSFSGSLNFSGASANSITLKIESNATYTGYEFGKTNEVKIADVTGGVLNFDSSFFNIDASGFNDGVGSWWLNWSVASHDNALWLQYQVVPEPSTYIIITLLCATVGYQRYRKRLKVHCFVVPSK